MQDVTFEMAIIESPGVICSSAGLGRNAGSRVSLEDDLLRCEAWTLKDNDLDAFSET